MNNILCSLLFVFTFSLTHAQQVDYNVNGGAVAEGYDVVSYFNGNAIEGSEDYKTTHEGAIFYFSNSKNLKEFQANPVKYTPQYGGWCAYAMGLKEDKVKIDPKTYEIRDGKLYLFYNSWGINTLKSWLAENPKTLQANADVNWNKIKYKK